MSTTNWSPNQTLEDARTTYDKHVIYDSHKTYDSYDLSLVTPKPTDWTLVTA